MTFTRLINLNKLLKQKSFFLFGPRSTGKTTLVRDQLRDAKTYDLLDSDVFTKLARRPKTLGEELTSADRLVVVDEIQKLPALLDEIHRLIETRNIRFLLTGSSARTLRRKGVNLLGGRAWEASLFPLCSAEIPDFDLVRYLNHGGLPHIYLSKNYNEELKSYANLYLREEVMAEALTRRIDQFGRFMDVMALQNGEELHYQALSSDAAVPARTLQNYVGILEDTLLGFQVHAFLATRKRKAIARSKFFFFDIGIVNFLAKRGEIRPKSELFGKCFEHFMFMEIRAFLGYMRKDVPIQYWRSTSGFEVDCVLGDQIAIEFKSTQSVTDRHLKGIKALREERLIKKYMVVSQDIARRNMDGIEIYPWLEFLSELWGNKIV